MPSLNWIGKSASDRAYAQAETRAIESRDIHNSGDVLEDNLLIQGDNFLGMKALAPFFSSQFKLIYMDPPYNTGNQTWIYNDAMNAPETKDWLDKIVNPNEDLSSSDKWLCMMQPRIEAAYQLLREDGILAVSIDDAEQAHLEELLNSQFGKENKIASLIWRTTSGANDSVNISINHEYIILYAKNKQLLNEVEENWKVDREYIDLVQEKIRALQDDASLTNESRQVQIKEWYRQFEKDMFVNLVSEGLSEEEAREEAKSLIGGYKNYWRFDDKGVFRGSDASWPGGGGPEYDVIHPVTGRPCVRPTSGWRYTRSTMDDHLKNDLILFGEDETTVPQFKRYLENVTQSTMRSVITDITGAQGTKELAEIFGEKKFPYPKPTKLISRLIDLTTNPGDSILDPFSGSGSTGHAVLKMNAENPTETPRRFVLIEMEEEIEKDVTSVRLDRVIKGYETKKGKKVAGLSGHYSRWKIGEPLLTARGSLNKEVSELAIAQILAGENNLPLVEDKTFPNNVIAEDDSKVVFYYSSEHGALDDDDIENVDAIRKGRQAVVYTINSYVDEERVGDEVRVLILPYDFPVLQ